MSGPFPSGSANPLAGGQNANPPATNPPAGGSPNLNPANVGNPAGAAGSNPLAGGSSGDQITTPPTSGDDPNTPISADVYREKMRSEAALRKRVQELEAYRTQQEDAKLTQAERDKKALDEFTAKEAAWLAERQSLRLARIVDARVRERNLVDASAVRAILMAEYADQLDYDDEGNPTNGEYLIDRAIEKYPFLVQAPPVSQPPGSGRPVSPPRTPAGQYAPRQPAQQQQQSVPPAQWPRLGDIDWTKPGGGQGPAGR